MSTTVLPGYPSIAQHEYVTTLGDTSYRFTFTWRVRQRAWYFDLELEDGTALIRGRKVSAGWFPLGAVDLGDNAPAGQLYVRGSDNYERADWGSELVLVFVPTADLTSATAVETQLGITLKAN